MNMICAKILALCLLVSIVTTDAFADFVEDYCWRDYDGVLPKDALIAGKARDGLPIYVGQVLYQNKLIPGKIHHNSSQIHIEFQSAHVLDETIKILCTTHPERFVWIKTNTYDMMRLMKTKHVFEGGYESGVLTYIGRAQSHDELTVGKVICWTDSHCIKLTTIEEGRWYDHGDFEIMTFDDTIAPEVTEPPTKATEAATTVTEATTTVTEATTTVTEAPTTVPEHHSSEVEVIAEPAPTHSKYTREQPEHLRKASPLAIFLLIAFVVIAAAVIVLLVRRC